MSEERFDGFYFIHTLVLTDAFLCIKFLVSGRRAFNQKNISEDVKNSSKKGNPDSTCLSVCLIDFFKGLLLERIFISGCDQIDKSIFIKNLVRIFKTEYNRDVYGKHYRK